MVAFTKERIMLGFVWQGNESSASIVKSKIVICQASKTPIFCKASFVTLQDASPISASGASPGEGVVAGRLGALPQADQPPHPPLVSSFAARVLKSYICFYL